MKGYSVIHCLMHFKQHMYPFSSVMNFWHTLLFNRLEDYITSEVNTCEVVVYWERSAYSLKQKYVGVYGRPCLKRKAHFQFYCIRN